MAPSVDLPTPPPSVGSPTDRLIKSVDGKLPVTLLSGFLGAGKTTLLTNILTSDHGLGKVAVIVNDIGSLNVDELLLSKQHISRRTAQLVEFSSGCICCTLRGDLLEEVAEMAAKKEIDYLVIESSGVSEPMQVAETFSPEFAEQHAQAAADLRAEMEIDPKSAKDNAKIADILAAGGLPAVSRLDTCVTVVDAVSIFADYDTADFLVDRNKAGDVPEEDDRCISDLMTDQLEFADVIICNKTDLVSAADVKKIRSLIYALNPEALFIPATRGQIDLSQILNTNRFSYQKAAVAAGWLKSLNEEELKPETEEYGIGTFVYRARRPFHPARLWKTLRNVFVLIQMETLDDGVDDVCELTNGNGDKAIEDAGSDDEEMTDAEADEESDGDESDSEAQPQLNTAARLAAKKASETWRGLLRSKGFLWLATRPLMCGEWSQAGVMLTLSGGGRWRCEVPAEDWPEDPEIVAAIKRDFQGPWKDRRQELVFIGQNMRKGAEEGIRAAMDACLLNDEEWASWVKVMTNKRYKTMEKKKAALEQLFEDGFEDWVDEDDPANHEGHDHA